MFDGGSGIEYFQTSTFYFRLCELMFSLAALVCLNVLNHNYVSTFSSIHVRLFSLFLVLGGTSLVLLVDMVCTVILIAEDDALHIKFDIIADMVMASCLLGAVGFCGQYADLKNSFCICDTDLESIKNSVMQAAIGAAISSSLTGGHAQISDVINNLDTAKLKSSKKLNKTFILVLSFSCVTVMFLAIHGVSVLWRKIE